MQYSGDMRIKAAWHLWPTAHIPVCSTFTFSLSSCRENDDRIRHTPKESLPKEGILTEVLPSKIHHNTADNTGSIKSWFTVNLRSAQFRRQSRLICNLEVASSIPDSTWVTVEVSLSKTSTTRRVGQKRLLNVKYKSITCVRRRFLTCQTQLHTVQREKCTKWTGHFPDGQWIVWIYTKVKGKRQSINVSQTCQQEKGERRREREVQLISL